MTFQDDLPEEEKSEWAMDIAFDMDEFFRQNDPQYAAEHPEAHAAKEELYESLMAGRISALDEKLAALVCNDEGKLIGLDLNRGLRDENGEIYDIVAGTFLVVGLGEENFASLSPELIQKYTEQFKTPERFMQINGNIVVLPVPAEKQDLAYLPDRFETGERVQTPRGSFQVTAMSREQMEAAGYGVHHISNDGKYLIMGNGTRAFAVAAEQPEKDNPLRTAEMTLEDAKREYSFSVHPIGCTPAFFIYFRHYQAFPFPLHFLSCQRLRH